MSEIARNFLKEKWRDRTILEFFIAGSGFGWYHGVIKSYDDEYILIEGRGVKDSSCDILLQQKYIETISIYKER